MHLFLLPHQDDEAPVFFEIERLAHEGLPVRIVYLTTGNASTEPYHRRNAESLAVLSRLGVPATSVVFLGDALRIQDGQLQKHLEAAFSELRSMVVDSSQVSIHVPAWEGGHHDHDAAYMLGAALAQLWKCESSSFQFPFYHGYRLPSILFRVLNAIDLNGPVVADTIPWTKRLLYMRLLFTYKTQLGSWIGLGPFYVVHILLRGTQVRQKLSIDRVRHKPHEGNMLYERRSFCTYSKFQTDTAAFFETHLPKPPLA